MDRVEFPYSLNVAAANLSFREVLVAEREDPASSKPKGQAFKFQVPAHFMEKRDVAVATGAITRVQGDCTPGKPTEPEMLRFAGGTALDDFPLRDLNNLFVHNGLRPDELDLAWNDCERGGGLHQRQGMLFVR